MDPTRIEIVRRVSLKAGDGGSSFRSLRNALRRAVSPRVPTSVSASRPFPRFRPKKRTDEQKAELRAWHKAHEWHPNQIRHTVATEVRAKFGLEAAQVLLGHSRADVTQTYAERDMAKAPEVARKIG